MATVHERANVTFDDETARQVQRLAEDGAERSGAAVSHMVERLRRLEDEARCVGGSRQTFQKIMSARRVLGDRVTIGRLEGDFMPDVFAPGGARSGHSRS